MQHPKIVQSQLWWRISSRITTEQIMYTIIPIVHQLMSVSWTRFRARSLRLRITMFRRVIATKYARPLVCLQRIHPKRIQIQVASFLFFAQAWQHINFVSFTIDCGTLRKTGRRYIFRFQIWQTIGRIDKWNFLAVNVIRNEISRVLFVALATEYVQFTIPL